MITELTMANDFSEAKTFRTVEKRIWEAKVSSDIDGLGAVMNILEDIISLQQPESDGPANPWAIYYHALLHKTLCDLGIDSLSNALSGIDRLKLAYGVETHSSEFYGLMGALRGYAAAATKDPIKKAKMGMVAERAFAAAADLDDTNPRLLLLEGLSVLHKPRLVGGSKKRARTMLARAADLFDSSLFQNEPRPNWGEAECYYWLANIELHFNSYDAALDANRKALEVAPNYPAAESQQVQILQCMQ